VAFEEGFRVRRLEHGLHLQATRPVIRPLCHFRLWSGVPVHSNKPIDVIRELSLCIKMHDLTWIRFFPSDFVTRGWSFGVVKV
jgi:hypothetical protein